MMPSRIKREKCAAQIKLCTGGLWERQDESQRQLQPLRQVHGHQLQFQRRSHRRTHQQLPAGEGEDGGVGNVMEGPLLFYSRRTTSQIKEVRVPLRHSESTE